MMTFNGYQAALGALYGQAVGDALGTTLEFRNAESNRKAFPGGLRRIVGGGAFDVEPGQVTDDTEMAMALAHSLVTEKCHNPRKVFAAYKAWANSKPIDIGGTTSSALLGDKLNHESEANGALMRVSPLGVFCWNVQSSALVAAMGRQDASLTHPNRICQDASGIYAATIARCVGWPGHDRFDVFDFALTLAKRLNARECIADLEAAQVGNLRANFDGHVRVAFSLAFYHLIHTDSFEEAVVETVMHGGDADTNGCIVGALLGAHQGVEAIPEHWIETVKAACVARPEIYQATGIESLTAKLLRAAEEIP